MTRREPGLTAKEKKVKDRIKEILRLLGEDPDREGLKKTPGRVEASLKFLTQGYKQDLESIVNNAVFSEEYDEMVLVKDIEFYSLCEHHLLPFFGKAHIAYIPDGKIIGLSKIPRIVDMFSRRLQVQERMTVLIASAIQKILKPKGVAVILEAVHLCMVMRGTEKKSSKATTSCLKGVFKTDPKTRDEFLKLIHGANS
jgi:GTP cyclohydrolase I